MNVQFPSSFLWGAALSSYQCEGENLNSDWHLWERKRGLQEAARACNHYHLFDEDFQLASSFNLNSLRFSVEWSRICPSPGDFSEKELKHYGAVVDSLLKYKLKPIVTLHHFTNPIWFNKKGGWLETGNIDFFIAYLKRMVSFLKDKVDVWLIFNEPLVYIYNSFIQGIWPPGEKSLKRAVKVLKNIVTAYCIGYEEIKRLYEGSSISPRISLAKNLRIFAGCDNSKFALNSFSAFFRDRCFNLGLLEYLNKKNVLDFIAVNYYCKEYTEFKGLIGQECDHTFHKERKNSLGWLVYPEGIYHMLLRLRKFGLPVLVTENGTSEIEECFYEDFLVKHLECMARAMLEGVDLIGYQWWSLLDNFEWDKGFSQRFGLVEVDYTNFERRVRPFAYRYAKICKENKMNI